jgi:hypothetical protein
MIPRIDPETRPHAHPMQIITRAPRDQYGAELRRTSPRPGTATRAVPRTRPVEIRNGIPVKHYRNWQQPRPSMTPDEAEAWLVYRYRSPGRTQ